MGPKEVAQNKMVNPGVAFRAGVKGLPFRDQAGPHPELPIVIDKPQGANELHMEMVEHLPGLTDVVGAYETGER